MWPQAAPVPLQSRRGDPRPAHLRSPAPWPPGRCQGSGPDTATAAVDVDPELPFQVETTDVNVLRTLEGSCPSRSTLLSTDTGASVFLPLWGGDPSLLPRARQPQPCSSPCGHKVALLKLRRRCPSCRPAPPPDPTDTLIHPAPAPRGCGLCWAEPRSPLVSHSRRVPGWGFWSPSLPRHWAPLDLPWPTQGSR